MPGRNSIFMRGISTGSAEYYTDSQVSIYLDDQPLTSVSQQVDIWPIDIERIESLPGPQGTLFGSSSQSGTLRYITNKPDVEGYSSQLDLEVGTIKGGEETYDVSGHLNIPVNDNFAVRVVGFYSDDGRLGRQCARRGPRGHSDNSDVVEDDWNEYEAYGGRIAARWLISPKWESTLSLISQYSYTDGSWDSDPALGDYKITRFFKEWREDDWYQASLNVKGDLGFAELSMTASYFDRNIDYEWDDMTYDQWRTQYYGVYLVRPLRHELPDRPDLQLAEAETRDVRGTTDVTGREPLPVDGRGVLRGRERLVGLRQGSAGTDDDPRLDSANNYAYVAHYYYGLDVQYPVAPTDDLLPEHLRQDDQAEGGVRRGDLRPHREMVRDGRDALVRVRPPRSRGVVRAAGRASLGPGAAIDPDTGELIGEPVGGRIESSGTDSDTVFKFATQYKFDDDRMVYFTLQRGVPPGRQQRCARGRNGLIEPSTNRTSSRTTKSASRAPGSTIGCSSTSRRSSWNGRTSSSTSDTDICWARGIFNGNDAEQQGIESDFIWNVTPNFVLEGSVFLGDPEFSEETHYRADPDDRR